MSFLKFCFIILGIFILSSHLYATSNLLSDLMSCETNRSECFVNKTNSKCNEQALQCQIIAYKKNSVSKKYVCDNLSDGQYNFSLETYSKGFLTRNDNFLKANNKLYYPLYSSPLNKATNIMDVNCENDFEVDMFEYDCNKKKSKEIDSENKEFSKKKLLYCGVKMIAYKNNEFTFLPIAYEVHGTSPAIRKVSIKNKSFEIKPIFLSNLKGWEQLLNIMKGKKLGVDYYLSYENFAETYDMEIRNRENKVFGKFKVDPFNGKMSIVNQ